MNKETQSFQAETKQLLDLMINSIYTHKEIFLRELISNASDAIDKLRFLSLTQPELLGNDEIFEISIKSDDSSKTLTISDNGIGMNRDDLIQNIGTIARSGSKNFLKQMQENSSAELELIGQFGVGFYSAFMIADRVIITTKKAGETDAFKWESEGTGVYTIEPATKDTHGTEITLYLKKNEENSEDETWVDYTESHTLQNLIKKYSNFIRYPIRMEVEHTEYQKNEDGSYKYDAEPTTERKIETINATKPIWLKDKKEIEQSEYNEFYKSEFHDWVDPLEVVHSKAEGTLEYRLLLFIPKKAPFDFNSNQFKKGVKLYSKNVYIMDRCETLIPDYYKFIKGLVESSDFSLNLSREVLQQNRELKVIAKNIEKKIHDTLLYMLQNEREKYDEFWNEFGKNIKSGIYSDFQAKDKLSDLLIFFSSNDSTKKVTLDEYISRMPEEQEFILYATGKDIESIEKMPQMESIKDKGWEVLYFVEKIDEFITNNLTEYKGKKLKSVSHGEFSVGDSVTKEKEDEMKPILEAIKTALEGKVSEVKLSNRLKSSPVCLVSGKNGISLNMEKVLKDYDAFVPKADRVLEINPNHKLFEVMTKIKDSDESRFKTYSNLLYNQALISEGIIPEDTSSFISQISELMINTVSE
ncbi:molecular chaperone HtpG [bacterium]|nr:molecular chaperone HtpG [bacterium]